MEYWGIIALLVSCWVLQVFMGMKQTKHYQASLNDVKKLPAGHIGVGIAKAKFNIGSGVIMIIATDLNGTVLDVRQMKGLTVFSRFKQKQHLIGKQVNELETLIKKKKELSAFEQALALINEERAKAKLVALPI